MPDNPSFWQFSLETIIPRLTEGLTLTLELTLLSGLFGIALGLFISLVRLTNHPVLANLARAYVALFRGTPLLLQILFAYFALPGLLDIRLEAFTAGVLALSLNCAAYLAEIFRAAISSIPKGQWEAAKAMGFRYASTLFLIILPQAFKRLIPPVVNELASLAKDTSLVSVIALSETLYITQRLGAKYLRPWEVYAWAALGYLLIVITLSTVANILEKRLSFGDK
ncbi:MAG: amino acid ABC transporter permease [Oligoflexales bacterium]